METDLQLAIKTQGDLIRSLKEEHAAKDKVISFVFLIFNPTILREPAMLDDAIIYYCN